MHEGCVASLLLKDIKDRKGSAIDLQSLPQPGKHGIKRCHIQELCGGYVITDTVLTFFCLDKKTHVN